MKSSCNYRVKGGDRSRELYRYLEVCQRREGRFPSYREIAAALGWKSTNTVSYHIERLVREGLLEKDPGKVRSFRLRRYRRSRYLKRQAEEFEIRATSGKGGSLNRNLWIDRGWFGGEKLSVWELSGDAPLPEGLKRGDCLLVDSAAEPAVGDLVLASVAEELLAGRIFCEGESWRLLVSEEPEEILILGEGSLAGEILGRVVGLLRRF
jgi:repressor LexA